MAKLWMGDKPLPEMIINQFNHAHLRNMLQLDFVSCIGTVRWRQKFYGPWIYTPLPQIVFSETLSYSDDMWQLFFKSYIFGVEIINILNLKRTTSTVVYI